MYVFQIQSCRVKKRYKLIVISQIQPQLYWKYAILHKNACQNLFIAMHWKDQIEEGQEEEVISNIFIFINYIYSP